MDFEKGNNLWDRAVKHIPGGNMLLSKNKNLFSPDYWPSYYSKVKGPYVWDLDGNKYLDFVLKLFFAFGFAFEIPIATFLVITTGLVSKDRIKAMRPYLIISFFVIGMFLTPPDIFSQLFLALPMWLLFEIGLFISIDKKN